MRQSSKDGYRRDTIDSRAAAKGAGGGTKSTSAPRCSRQRRGATMRKVNNAGPQGAARLRPIEVSATTYRERRIGAAASRPTSAVAAVKRKIPGLKIEAPRGNKVLHKPQSRRAALSDWLKVEQGDFSSRKYCSFVTSSVVVAGEGCVSVLHSF